MDRNTIIQWLRAHPHEVEGVVRDAKILRQWTIDQPPNEQSSFATRHTLRGVLHQPLTATVNLLDPERASDAQTNAFAYAGTIYTPKGPQVVATGTNPDKVKREVAQALVADHGWAAHGRLLEWTKP